MKTTQQQKKNKIILKVGTNQVVFLIDLIIRIEAHGNYSLVISGDGCFKINKQIKLVENCFNDRNFYRIHNSHLINLDYIKEIKNENQMIVVLDNGEEIPVSETNKSNFVNTIENFFFKL